MAGRPGHLARECRNNAIGEAKHQGLTCCKSDPIRKDCKEKKEEVRTQMDIKDLIDRVLRIGGPELPDKIRK